MGKTDGHPRPVSPSHNPTHSVTVPSSTKPVRLAMLPAMKIAISLAAGLIALPSSAGAAPDQDPVPDQFRSAYESYRAEEYGATIEQLREIITTLEERTEKVLGEKVLPDTLGPWRGAPAKNEDLSFLGGGASVSRIYLKGRDSITAKIVKDSPFVDQFLDLIANDELLAWRGKKSAPSAGRAPCWKEAKARNRASS